MFKILLLASFIPALLAFRACNDGALPDSIDSNLCAPNEECQIAIGDQVDVTATFTAGFATDSFSPRVIAHTELGSLEVPIDDDIIVGCDSLIVGACPIEAGSVVTYQVNVPVDNLPVSGVAAEVELALVAADGSVLVCILFDAFIN